MCVFHRQMLQIEQLIVQEDKNVTTVNFKVFLLI